VATNQIILRRYRHVKLTANIIKQI